jgi:isopropylmalate/homocitrate/citramalate synthase
MTAGNDGVFAPVSSRSCYLGIEFHNTKCLATLNSLAAVLGSWDMKQVTQVGNSELPQNFVMEIAKDL